MKKKASIVLSNTKNTTKNITEFVEATALAIVSGYAIWSAIYQHKLERVEDYILLFSGALIAVLAAQHYLRHFSK